MTTTAKSVSTLRVSPPNERPFLLHCPTSSVPAKLLKYPSAVVLGETTAPAPGIVPTHVGKTIAEERAEVAAAKLKKQAPKPVKVKPETVVKPPAPKPALAPKKAKVSRLKAKLKSLPGAKPVVCLSTGAYYQSVRNAERDNNLKVDTLMQALRTQRPVLRENKVFAYASRDETEQQRCLRTVSDITLPGPIKRCSGKAIELIETGEVFRSIGEFVAKKRVDRAWFSYMTPGEVRKIPIGHIRLAQKQKPIITPATE